MTLVVMMIAAALVHCPLLGNQILLILSLFNKFWSERLKYRGKLFR